MDVPRLFNAENTEQQKESGLRGEALKLFFIPMQIPRGPASAGDDERNRLMMTKGRRPGWQKWRK